MHSLKINVPMQQWLLFITGETEFVKKISRESSSISPDQYCTRPVSGPEVKSDWRNIEYQAGSYLLKPLIKDMHQ